MRKVWAAGAERLRWQVGKEGGVLERDARAAGGEASEKADGQAGEARGWAAGMGRDGRGGTGWAGFEMATRLSKANTCSANFGLRLFSKAMAGPLVPANLALWSFHTHSRRNEVLMNFEGPGVPVGL